MLAPRPRRALGDLCCFNRSPAYRKTEGELGERQRRADTATNAANDYDAAFEAHRFGDRAEYNFLDAWIAELAANEAISESVPFCRDANHVPSTTLGTPFLNSQCTCEASLKTSVAPSSRAIRVVVSLLPAMSSA